MFLALLFACGGGTPAAKPARAPVENSEVANILEGLQSGQTPDPKPADQEPPAVPADVAARAPEPAPETSSGTRKDSPACSAAHAKRDAHEAAIASYQEKDLVAAEQRWLNAEAAMTWCVGDATCASEGEDVKKYHISAQLSEKAYEDAQAHVGELEADFYGIDQEIQAACGGSRE